MTWSGVIPRNSKRGGVYIYFKENLIFRNDISPLAEWVVCEIKIKRSNCFVSCIYRSSNQSEDKLHNFSRDFETTCENIAMENPVCSVVLGDFNAKNKKWWSTGINNTCGLLLDDLSVSLGLSQLISESTNFEPNKSPSCIDLIFCQPT